MNRFRHLISRRLAPVVLFGAMLGAISASASAVVRPSAELRRDATAKFVKDEVVVRFKAGTTAVSRKRARQSAGTAFERPVDGIPRAQVVAVEGGVKAALERLDDQPEVAYAQPNFIYRAQAAVPDDPYFEFGQLWNLTAVDALSAWDVTQGAGQVIAVVDTGVDLSHPELIGNLWTNPSPNLISNDVHGYDFVDDDGTPDDFNFHGTHVAGTAAAEAGNGIGIAGVAPQAQIMAVRVLNGDGEGTTDQVAAGIDYAAEHGADVINLSLGGEAGDGDDVMSEAIVSAGQDHDSVVVAASGNSHPAVNNDLSPHTPCHDPDWVEKPSNMLCVAASQHDDSLAVFSHYGANSVDLAAPGRSIVSAETAYSELFYDGFESAGLPGWSGDKPPWHKGTPARVGTGSASDSVGSYLPSADNYIVRTEGVSLLNRQGCRMHFALRLDMEPFPAGDDDPYDAFEVGLDALVGPGSGYLFAGSISSFVPMEIAFNELDGNPDVAPYLGLHSDADGAVGDGAQVDQLQLLCRTSDPGAYDGESYRSLDGTSMATPHVAGVAALARAAALSAGTDASAGAIVEAIRDGVRPVAPTPGMPTATNGIADACRTVALVTEVTPVCPSPDSDGGGDTDDDEPTGSTSQPTGGDGAPSPGGAGATTQRPMPPAAPDLSRAKSRIRVKRSRFAYRIAAGPGLAARAVFRTRRKAKVGGSKSRRRRHLTVERRRFTVPAAGHVTLKVRLSRREMRILRRNRRLLLRVTVTVRNASGQSAKATKRLSLISPR